MLTLLSTSVELTHRAKHRFDTSPLNRWERKHKLVPAVFFKVNEHEFITTRFECAAVTS